jgi:C4-dicarboxylate-specific signal transduction histidine kinase
VLNLVMNAIEAMRETDTRARTLCLKSRCDEYQDVIVHIADNGAGLDAAHLEHIFDAFITTKAEGMGMGLAICNSIVRGHGGHLSAAAANPHGANFCFSLPAIRDPVS